MNQLPYEVYISKHVHRDAKAWCRQRWGQEWSVINNNRAGVWSCFWAGTRGANRGDYRYVFEHQQDAMLFSLRWIG
jgi:hypothetical protein